MKREHGVMQTPRRKGRSFRSKDSRASVMIHLPFFFFCSWTHSGSNLSLRSFRYAPQLLVEQIQPGKLSCPTTLCSASHFGGTYEGFLPWLQLEQMTSPTLSISFLPPPLSEAPHFSFSLSLPPFLDCVCLSVHVKGLYKVFGVLFARSWAGNYLPPSKGSAWRTLHMQHSESNWHYCKIPRENDPLIHVLSVFFFTASNWRQ